MNHQKFVAKLMHKVLIKSSCPHNAVQLAEMLYGAVLAVAANHAAEDETKVNDHINDTVEEFRKMIAEGFPRGKTKLKVVKKK